MKKAFQFLMIVALSVFLSVVCISIAQLLLSRHSYVIGKDEWSCAAYIPDNYEPVCVLYERREIKE